VKEAFLSLILIAIASLGIAQEIPQEIIDQIETYIEDGENEEADILNLYERLLSFYNAPLNINTLTYDEIKELGMLSDIQIMDILNHRDIFGDFLSIEEIQSIHSIQADLAKILQYFLWVKDSNKMQVSIPQMLKQSNNELYLKASQIVQDKKGYIPNEDGETKYLGDKNRVFLRWRNSFSTNQRMGIILEKDAGEEIFKSAKNAGFDYLTFHYYLKDYSNLIKEVAVGDYTLSFGQGLISHNSFGSGKSAYVSNVRKGGRVVRPYNSVQENSFYRGAAATLSVHNHIDLSIYGSHVNRDGNALTVIDTIDPENPVVERFSSFQLSGNHRTASEKEDQGTIAVSSYGASLQYSKPNFGIAINTLANNFNGSLDRSDNLYNRYRYRGDHLHNASIDYNYRYRNFNFFGESAISSTDNGTAHIIGALVGLSRKFSTTLMYRNYSRSYNSINPNGFGEGTTVNNEVGFYMGMEYRIDRKWTVRAYADYWKHPWLRFNISRPSSGREYLIRIDYYIKRKLLIYAQYIHENKLADYSTVSRLIKNTGFQKRHRLRLNVDNTISKELKLRSRLEFSRFENPMEQSYGVLLYQDVIYKPQSSPLSLSTRIAYFDTDDFDSRIYAFENSVLYEFSILSYFNQGVRYYINARYKATRALTIELRLAQTKYSRTGMVRDPNSPYLIEAISSGNEQIIGNQKTEIKMQMRYKF